MTLPTQRPRFQQLKLRLQALAASTIALPIPQQKLREAYRRVEKRSLEKIVNWVQLAELPKQAISGDGRYPTVLLLQPVGDRCNLACTYCYEALRQAKSGKIKAMSVPEMREQVSKALRPPSMVAEIYLHGGEPLLAGKNFFEEFVAAVRASSNGSDVKIGVQTNAVLIDEEWARIFEQGSVKVGVSLDGDPIINDMHRLSSAGRSSYKQAERGIGVLQRFGIAFGVISVFTQNVACTPGAAGRILRHFSDLGIREFDMHPAFTPMETSGTSSQHNVQPDSYAKFMSSAFDEWLAFVAKEPIVRTFEDFFLALNGTSSDVCYRSGQCMSIVGVTENGEMQPCTRPFHPKYRFGSLRAIRSLAEIVQSGGYDQFEKAEFAGQCSTADCKWRAFCGNGGCPHERFLGTAQDPRGRHIFCTCHANEAGGYPGLFEHMASRILHLTDDFPIAAS